MRLESLTNGRYRLSGAKTFASGAGHLVRPLITGALPDGQGWQLFVLPADRQPPVLDRSFWRPLGMRATASFRADLTGLEIGQEDLIGPPNSYYQQPAFGSGAIRFAAVQLGGAEAVFDETRSFLRDLGRTSDPYQRQRLGEMVIALESGRQWLRRLIRVEGDVHLAERSVGARGLLQPRPFERLHRDLTHYLRQPAPDGSLADVGRFVLEGPGF